MKFVPYLLAAGLLPLSLSADTLSMVPMQGGMVMPMIRYDEDMGRLHVMMPADIPQLTPLLISHPGDQFDPAHPWFNDLNPTATGLSFSRRYGFVMDLDSDPLPAQTEIWIRKVSGPPDLKFYRYATSPAPGVWAPIYGADGSPAAQMWNTMMFHPAVTAPPGTNGYVAVFEAYLVDIATMTEIPDSGTGPMVFTFTNVPDGRPRLDVELMAAIGWDPGVVGYALESTAVLESGVWTAVTNVPVLIDGRATVLMPPGEVAGRYYRMRQVP